MAPQRLGCEPGRVRGPFLFVIEEASMTFSGDTFVNFLGETVYR